TLAVARHVRQGYCCVDVGANCGYYTLLLASLIGPEGRVWACEPIPSMVPLLRQSVQLNGFESRVEVVETAVLESSRAVELHMPGSDFPNALNATILGSSYSG